VKKSAWIILFIVFFFGLCLTGGIYLYAELEKIAAYDPYEASISRTKRFIEWVKQYPAQDLPKDVVPNNLWNDECWELLQSIDLENSDEFEYKAFDNGTWQFRDVEDILVHVQISNDIVIQFVYYQGGLVSCDFLSGDE
jgi:hypothetical protein